MDALEGKDIDMSEQEIAEELKWYREEEVLELPFAENKSVGEEAARGNGGRR